MGLPLVSVVLLRSSLFSIASDAFLSLRNLTGITGQASTLLLACLGASFVDPDGQHRPFGRSHACCWSAR